LGGRGLLARRHRRFDCLRCHGERKLDGGPSGRQISSADILPHHSRFLVFGNVAMIHEGIAWGRRLVKGHQKLGVSSTSTMSAQKEDAICPCFQSERFSFQSCCFWRLRLPSLAKTPHATGHAGHVATPGTRAKGAIPALTVSPTIISAERLVGECVVSDWAL